MRRIAPIIIALSVAIATSARAKIIKLDVDVRECNTSSLTMTFTDQNGDPVVPSSASYRIDSRVALAGSYEVLDDVGFTPASSTVRLTIPASAQVLHGKTSPEEHILTIEWSWGASGHGQQDYSFTVSDVLFGGACP